MKNFDKIHAQNQAKYAKEIRLAYVKAVKYVSKLGKSINHPNVTKNVNKIISDLYFNVNGVTMTGVNSEWDLAVEKNNQIAQQYFGKNWDDLPKDLQTKYLSTNDKARQSFVERKIKGLGISDRVWRNTQQFKQELELAIEFGIDKGLPASRIAQNIQKYLNEPSKLFRRVRDKNGKLQLSKAAAKYHPGQGVYRSSYKNALRLATNETNLSYENSNFKKRQQQDFVVGQKISVSPQHKPSDDKGGIVCVHLQGLYPKEFDFTYRWHVKCKCVSQSVLKTKQELSEDMDLILDGKPPKTLSINDVKGVPDNYVQYIKNNEKKWENWATKPRTFTNNPVKDFGVQTPVQKIPLNPFGVDVRTILENLHPNQFEDDLFLFAREKNLGLSIDEIAKIADSPNKVDLFLDLLNKYGKEGDYYIMNKFQYEALSKLNPLPLHIHDMLYYKQYGYIGTTNYSNINRYLRKFKSDIAAQSAETIRHLDIAIDRRVLPENTILYRNADREFLRTVFGVNGNKLDDFVKGINKKLKDDFVYSDKGFTSTSSIQSQNVFQSREISIKIKTPKGTNVYITDNLDESEVIFARNQKFRVISVKKSTRTYKTGWGSKEQTIDIIELEVVAI